MSRLPYQCLPSPKDVSPRLQQRLQWDPILFTWCTDSPWTVGLTDKVVSPEWPDSTGASMMNSPSMVTSSPKGEQVVILPSCRDNIMADLHGSHASINKAMDLARTCVFTGPAWKQTSPTTSSSALHALSAATYQLRCCTPTRSLPDLG